MKTKSRNRFLAMVPQTWIWSLYYPQLTEEDDVNNKANKSKSLTFETSLVCLLTSPKLWPKSLMSLEKKMKNTGTEIPCANAPRVPATISIQSIRSAKENSLWYWTLFFLPGLVVVIPLSITDCGGETFGVVDVRKDCSPTSWTISASKLSNLQFQCACGDLARCHIPKVDHPSWKP